MTALLIFIWTLGLSCGQLTAQDFTQPFEVDQNTVVLYHFDEGEGDETRDACGDPELTLRAHKEALWGSRAGFGATARFRRREDDANVLVGPVDNPKLELRGCTREWTIEAWVRHTGGSVPTPASLDPTPEPRATTSIRSAGPTLLSSSPMMSGTMWRGSFGTKIRCISCFWTGS